MVDVENTEIKRPKDERNFRKKDYTKNTNKCIFTKIKPK